VGGVDVVALAQFLASDIRQAARKSDMLRTVRQFIMDCDRATDLHALLAGPPASTGDDRWDALLAGVVEDIAYRHRIPAPAWAVSAVPLASWWFVTDFATLHPTAFLETPPAVARHGVFIRRASLVNV
jgi:hypothetical protein